MVSDCYAIDYITTRHRYANSSAAGAAAALLAGTDMACEDYSALVPAVLQGLVPQEALDAALRRVLLAR